MDHSKMDHSHHSMPGMDMPSTECSMSMLWNWNVKDTCVIFSSWHITSNFTMFISCLMVVTISFLYEALQYRTSAYERRLANALIVEHGLVGGGTGGNGRESGRSSPVGGGFGGYGQAIGLPPSVRLVRAVNYSLSVFVSFMIMLIFMSYNGYLIASVVLGAGLGHWFYQSSIDPLAMLGGGGGKGMACH